MYYKATTAGLEGVKMLEPIPPDWLPHTLVTCTGDTPMSLSVFEPHRIAGFASNHMKRDAFVALCALVAFSGLTLAANTADPPATHK